MQYSFINTIRNQLVNSLPGVEAQNRMAPSLRNPYNKIKTINPAKKAAVIILLYQKNNYWFFPLIKRTIDNSPHSGQVALPGGAFEPTDINIITTALREAQEEIGVCKNNIDILGMLTPLYVPVSNFYIQPVVGYLSNPKFRLYQNEVEVIIHTSLTDIMHKSNCRNIIINHNHIRINAPYYNANGHHVWGATAMILSEFFEIITMINKKTT